MVAGIDSPSYIIIDEKVKNEWLFAYKQMLVNAIEDLTSTIYQVSIFNVQNCYTKRAKAYQKAAHRVSFWELIKNAELLKHCIN